MFLWLSFSISEFFFVLMNIVIFILLSGSGSQGQCFWDLLVSLTFTEDVDVLLS